MTEPASLHVIGEAHGLLAEGREILERQSAASWAFADWSARPELADRPVGELADAVGISRQKLGDYRSVSMAWPHATRVASLTFSHHRAASRAPQAERAGILAEAAERRWSVARTAAAAREVSLEGKVARLRRENAELKRALKAAKSDPKDAVAQTRSRLDAERRVILDAFGRADDLVTEVAESGVLDGLHGNARAGLAAHIDVFGKKLAKAANDHFGRIEAAARKIRSQK